MVVLRLTAIKGLEDTHVIWNRRKVCVSGGWGGLTRGEEVARLVHQPCVFGKDSAFGGEACGLPVLKDGLWRVKAKRLWLQLADPVASTPRQSPPSF